MIQQTQYETGAKSHEVNNLILFYQNTPKLLNIDRATVTAEQFIKAILKQYETEIKETHPELTNQQKRDLLKNI